MTKTLVFGHKNPDTDTICSAISYAELKKAQGADIEAVRLESLIVKQLLFLIISK